MTVESVPVPAKRFRHKEQFVHAWQAGGNDSMPDWEGLSTLQDGGIVAMVAGVIDTVGDGDVVIRAEDGELWVCSPESFADLYEIDTDKPTLSDADRLQGTAIAANGSFRGIPMLDMTREDAIAGLAFAGLKITELMHDNRRMAEELERRSNMPRLIIPGR